MIRQAREIVPREILSELVETCVKNGRHRQLTALVETWPEPSFKIAPRSVGDHLDYLREQQAIADIDVASERNEKLKKKFNILASVLQKVFKLFNETGK